MPFARLAFWVLVPLSVFVSAAAPPVAQQATFRSTTALVQVDAIVIDGDGRFVSGLRPEDLQIFEDGKPQKIEQFFLVTHDPVTRASAIAADDAGRPAEKAHRLFVLVFDEGHLAHDSMVRLRRGAEDFIMQQMSAGDVAGIFVNGQLHQGRLTTDKGSLLAGVRAVKPAFETRASLLAPLRDFPRIPTEIDATRVASGDIELLKRLGAEACRQNQYECEALGPNRFSEVENKLQQKARLYVRQARMLTSQTVQSLDALITGLSRYAGRKTIVFMSEGFFIEESRATIERLGAHAARAGVTIYSIDGRGLTMATGIPDVIGTEATRSMVFDTGDDGPAILTATTGGLAVRNVDDMPRAFRTIANDTSTYYVIGYSPAKPVMDGKFRKIEVKARTKGLRVRARKGYLATPLPPQETLVK